VTGGTRTEPGTFEARYRADTDPWGFATEPYEQAKYARTLAALGPRHFAAALELGCSIGVLTERLAPRCDRLVALDAAPTAVARARTRLAGVPTVTVLEGLVPEDLPPGPWELVVASEILYYLDAALLDLAVERLAADLAPGGLLLAVHWTGVAASHALPADVVHARLLAATGLRGVHAETHEHYRLDLLERAG
jgi:trans-aconitate methyltransferase